MITIPVALKNEIEKSLGRNLKARVTINYSSVYGNDLIFNSHNGQNAVSQVSQLYNGRRDVPYKWISLDGSWVLGDDYRLAPVTERGIAENEIGFWGDRITKADLTFENSDAELYGTNLFGEGLFGSGIKYPAVSIYFQARTITGIDISFDNARNEFATIFDVIFYDGDGNVLLNNSVTNNSGARYRKDITPIFECVKMTVLVKKWNVRSVVKIAEMLTSVQEVYNGRDLFSLRITDGISQSRIGLGRCVVQLFNRFRRFDYDNTQSVLFNQIRRGVVIRPEIGDGTNWLPLGEFYAEAWDIKKSDMRVTVTGIDKLGMLQATNYSNSKIIEPPEDQTIAIDNDAKWLAGVAVNIVVDGGIELA